jgi:hypothetical protein
VPNTMVERARLPVQPLGIDMSANPSKAVATILQAIDGVLLGTGKQRYSFCDSSENGAQLLEFYREAVRYLESKLGKPGYSGRGPSYPNVGAVADPGVFLDDFSRSMEISWWKTEQGVYAVLLSGHDADTLHCFTVEFFALIRKADA